MKYHTAVTFLDRCKLLVLVCLLFESAAAGEPSSPGIRPPTRQAHRVVVVRKPGCETYEKVIEEFRGRVRGIVRVVSASPAQRAQLLSWLSRYNPHLILAVGQTAYDMLRDAGVGPLLHVLVFHRLTPRHTGVPGRVPPDRVLDSFSLAKPGIRTIAVLHGSATRTEMERAYVAAIARGIELVRLRASSPPHAITLLRRIKANVQGIWLMTDLAVLTPQVVQYALGIQFRKRLPLMGATRKHVRQGALFSMDYSPHDTGRQCAALANGMLTAPKARSRAATTVMRARLSVNRSTAQSIGVPLARFKETAELLQ
jgi:hypothetical protein